MIEVEILESLVPLVRAGLPYEGVYTEIDAVDPALVVGHKQWVFDGPPDTSLKHLLVLVENGCLSVSYFSRAEGGYLDVEDVALADPDCFEKLTELVVGHSIWDDVK